MFVERYKVCTRSSMVVQLSADGRYKPNTPTQSWERNYISSSSGFSPSQYAEFKSGRYCWQWINHFIFSGRTIVLPMYSICMRSHNMKNKSNFFKSYVCCWLFGRPRLYIYCDVLNPKYRCIIRSPVVRWNWETFMASETNDRMVLWPPYISPMPMKQP